MTHEAQQNPPRESRHYGLLFLRGMAMGAADVVPGVSGGTIAFITGIYEELIDSIKSCDHRALQVLFGQGVVAAWRHINGNFLLTLVAGLMFSVFSLAKAVTYCLEQWPIPVWSFFFGLVLAACIHLGRQISSWNWSRLCWVLVGLMIALLVSQIRPTELPEDWWVLMGAGSIAICAMILPGVSGGFLLLIMGLYPTILKAIGDLNLEVLGFFAVGGGLGLILFSHLLSWLLHRYHESTMALLTGFLAGSLTMLWPWRITLESVIDRHGDTRPLVQQVVLPWDYTAQTGEASYLLVSMGLFVFGVSLVLMTELWQAKSEAHR